MKNPIFFMKKEQKRKFLEQKKNNQRIIEEHVTCKIRIVRTKWHSNEAGYNLCLAFVMLAGLLSE